MKKVILIGVAFLSLFLFAFKANAATCDEKIINDAKKVKAVAKVAKVKEYGYDVTRFKVTIKNLTSDMYAKVDLCDTAILTYTKKKNSSIYAIYEMPCETTAYIYSNGNSCDKDTVLAETKLFIPQYNPYSSKPICQKYDDYEYCQQTFNKITDLYNDVEPKIEALEQRDPNAAKAKKGNVLVDVVGGKLNITHLLIIASCILGACLIVIVIISVITYRRKTRK